MGWRKIIVDNTEYRWKCGRSFVTVQTAAGKRVALSPCDIVVGLSIEEWERARRKGYGSVFPSHIETLIKDSLKCQQNA